MPCQLTCSSITYLCWCAKEGERMTMLFLHKIENKVIALSVDKKNFLCIFFFNTNFNQSFLQQICKKSGWKIGTDEHTRTKAVFCDIWRYLQDDGDLNLDGRITAEEWVGISTIWRVVHIFICLIHKICKSRSHIDIFDS